LLQFFGGLLWDVHCQYEASNVIEMYAKKKSYGRKYKEKKKTKQEELLNYFPTSRGNGTSG